MKGIKKELRGYENWNAAVPIELARRLGGGGGLIAMGKFLGSPQPNESRSNATIRFNMQQMPFIIVASVILPDHIHLFGNIPVL
ncbi:MAG TPA: hypothetical protein VKF38_08345 [Anaerolineaceae bacterium]|nr:hypothetical protein [Anaerolineaceae bacterium]